MEAIARLCMAALNIIAAAIICPAMKESIGFLLNDTARLFRRAFNSRMRDRGITALQWRLLSYFKRQEGIRQGPRAELIAVEPITLSRQVDRMAAAARVQRAATHKT